MSVLDTYPAGAITRFHTIGGTQTVSDHTWGVALILAKLHPNPSAELFKAAIYHDVPEVFTGDVPATAKWASDSLTAALDEMESKIIQDWGLEVELSLTEKAWLKAADMLELILHCRAKVQQGDKRYEAIFVRGVMYLNDSVTTPKEIHECLKAIVLEKQ